MGSSNGVTRGQLRPYFSGRTPPFILVGTLIILIIFGFSYWSLNSQYGDLQIEVHDFQEQLRSASQKRIELEKQSRSLNEQLDTAQKTSSKCQNSLKKREEELTDLAEQLRDMSTAQSQLDAAKSDLDRCQEDKMKNDGEFLIQKEQFKQLETENGLLKKTTDEMQQKVNFLENEVKLLQEQLKNKKTAPDMSEINIPQVQQIPAVPAPLNTGNTSATAGEAPQPTVANPDVGLPPGDEVPNGLSQDAANKKLQKPEEDNAAVNEHVQNGGNDDNKDKGQEQNSVSS